MSQISWQKKEQILWQITVIFESYIIICRNIDRIKCRVTCRIICPFSASLFVIMPLLKLREGIAYG